MQTQEKEQQRKEFFDNSWTKQSTRTEYRRHSRAFQEIKKQERINAQCETKTHKLHIPNTKLCREKKYINWNLNRNAMKIMNTWIVFCFIEGRHIFWFSYRSRLAQKSVRTLECRDKDSEFSCFTSIEFVLSKLKPARLSNINFPGRMNNTQNMTFNCGFALSVSSKFLGNKFFSFFGRNIYCSLNTSLNW